MSCRLELEQVFWISSELSSPADGIKARNYRLTGWSKLGALLPVLLPWASSAHNFHHQPALQTALFFPRLQHSVKESPPPIGILSTWPITQRGNLPLEHHDGPAARPINGSGSWRKNWWVVCASKPRAFRVDRPDSKQHTVNCWTVNCGMDHGNTSPTHSLTFLEKWKQS